MAETQYGAEYRHPPESHAFFRSVLQAALARLATAPPVRVLEIGCGNGYWLREAAATTAAAGLQVSLAGVDLTPALIECARLQLQDLDPVPELSLGDILAAGGSDSCHLCYAYDLVQQIDGRDHLTMLEHLRSSLPDGGVCVLFDRDPWSRYGLKMRLRKALTRRLGLNLVPEFYLLARYPSFGRLARLARRIGLAVVEDRRGASRRALVLQR